MGSPLHSLYSLRSRSAFVSSDGLRVVVVLMDAFLGALGLHLLLLLLLLLLLQCVFVVPAFVVAVVKTALNMHVASK